MSADIPQEYLRYKDKVAIVTGGSKGIGEGCVRVFVRHGAKVVFCSRGENEGRQLEEVVNKTGPGESLYVKCDISKEDEIKNLIDTTVEKYGRIDCLINNAGWHPPFTRIDDFSADDFRSLLNLNLVSYFIAGKYALPHLRKTKGNIINMSSLVGQLGQLGSSTYVATKGGISALTRALAVDEAEHEVRVNTVSPGNVWTPLWNDASKDSDDPAMMKEAGADAQLLGRFGTIEETGELCLFLAAEGTFITGIDVPFSGGAELGYACKTRIGNKKGVY
ncbi:17-beta-hydroxysteroid dehydrogenase 14-like [Lineus longissimus]|uniref:17-beta-hydroxysteroid dehydrogenase 14-like n=1 Tax=Lineus longissimus TaxID=88925 RepID=UPI002B4E5C4E